MEKNRVEKRMLGASKARSTTVREGAAEISNKKLSVAHRQDGLIGLILLIIIALALLKYFLNWDIFDAAESDEGKSTILYIREIFNAVWGYIGQPVMYAWENAMKPLLTVFWETLQAFMDWARVNAQQGI